MPTDDRCQSCGKTVATDALMGLCPDCLLKAGMPTGSEAASRAAGGPFQPPPPEELGRFFPQLEILDLLGRGGMGAVYKARQTQLDRFVAVKILPPDISHDPAFAVRFAREAKALAKLNHPNIVTLYEFGQTDGMFYFIMEFVDGLNLRQLLHAGRIAPREALAIVPQICDALQYAHDAGIVHRDIKPENILLDRRGRVKVADFGLAKLVGRAEPDADGTAAGTATVSEAGKVVGTPQYMAPEQTNNPASVDNRADIYSLGVVFYQMLTGELPTGKTFQPPSSRMRGIVIDVRLDDVVLRALEKEPEHRYRHVSEIKTMVETIVTTPPANAGPPADRDAPATSSVPPAMTPLAERRWRFERTASFLGTIILAAMFFVVLYLALVFPMQAPVLLIMIVVDAIGPCVSALSLAGYWPFPSSQFPQTIFGSRNIPRLRTEARETGAGSAQPPRFSRTAIVGTVWAATVLTLFMAAAVVIPMTRRNPVGYPQKTNKSGNRPTAISTSTLTFGPVIERVVTNEIDLDTGSLQPEELKGSGHYSDALYEDPVFVFAASTERIQLTGNDWDGLSPGRLLTALDKRINPAEPDFNKKTEKLPVTLGFRTRSGRVGILQILSFVGNPQGVKIRYKLVARHDR